MNHTPGPWRVVPAWIAQKDSPALNFGEYVIAGIPSMSKAIELERTEVEANAVLIETAPELLEVLNELAQATRHWLKLDSQQNRQRVLDAESKAESVIAKVEGR
jgi:hypothetical protein